MTTIGSPRVLIIELGSQTTLLIGRVARELGVRSIVLEPKRAEQWLDVNDPLAVICSGSDASVYDDNAPQPPRSVLTKLRSDGTPVPVLCICYGMQWMSKELGGEVTAAPEHRAYGPETIFRARREDDILFGATPDSQQVWMSHGDSVTSYPVGSEVLAKTASGAVASYRLRQFHCVQFHPEVTHTDYGRDILANFLFGIAGCTEDWEPTNAIAQMRSDVFAAIGPQDKAVFGFSGGVDSSTLAAMLAPMLGRRLLAVTIDGGQFRIGELDEIKEHANLIGVELAIINVKQRFAEAFADTIDAEEKRARFRQIYSETLQEVAREFGASWLIQGTLAPDKIESGATGGAMIKTHHNVGLDTGGLRQLHPFDHLFKYEVRDLGRVLGLPESICEREPFPGPGLFLRVNGVPAIPEMVALVAWATSVVCAILAEYGVTRSQLVVSYNGTRTTGVKGDKRVYGGAIVVRAVQTLDFMTATGVFFGEAVSRKITAALTKHPQVVRTYFDYTDKPPVTTEPE